MSSKGGEAFYTRAIKRNQGTGLVGREPLKWDKHNERMGISITPDRLPILWRRAFQSMGWLAKPYRYPVGARLHTIDRGIEIPILDSDMSRRTSQDAQRKVDYLHELRPLATFYITIPSKANT